MIAGLSFLFLLAAVCSCSFSFCLLLLVKSIERKKILMFPSPKAPLFHEEKAEHEQNACKSLELKIPETIEGIS
jgi:hypothetical protein